MTDKKLRILQATQKLITQQGYEHLTISRIAQECGIGKGTVYEYFDSKEALLNQALSHYARLECDVICAPCPKRFRCRNPFIRWRCAFAGSLSATPPFSACFGAIYSSRGFRNRWPNACAKP
ncbi:MAG: TetR/AcrR family transcriptional regulator [Christensenellales bacterium]